jgi:hypothetical protein
VDFSAVAVIALLVILAAAATLISRQGLFDAPLSGLRLQDLGGRHRDGDEAKSDASMSTVVGDATGADQSAARVTPPPPATMHYPVSSAPALEPVGPQLDRLDAKLTELSQSIDRHETAIAALLRQSMNDLSQRAAAIDARSDAALERLRADVLASLASSRAGTGCTRRQDVCAELYVTLARLESALAAVSNPVLLPGEPFALPDELPASALVWENWNDVGERVFVLADTFNAQRLHLSQETRHDVAQFLTTLRTLLTGTIYPNLQSNVGSSQHLALRKALNDIARGLPNVRETLEYEYEGRTLR